MKDHYKKAVVPLLRELRLFTMARVWECMAQEAMDKNWSTAKYLLSLCEHELAERKNRRLQRYMKESQLPKAKTLSTFDFSALPKIDKKQISTLASGEIWVEEGNNVLLFGPSGVGKTHLAAAIGEQLIINGCRVFFSRTTELVQKLQAAKRDLSLPSLLTKLDKFDCLILDDFGYVKKDQYESSVLFELICERYERRSIIITANQSFTEWQEIFADTAMTIAATDRLVHHSTIVEMNTESYRKREAVEKKQKAQKV